MLLLVHCKRLILFLAACAMQGPLSKGRAATQFTGVDVLLEDAIINDDPSAVEAALAHGASINARGAGGVSPTEFAVGTFRKRALAALLAHKADLSLRDDGGETALTIAAKAYRRDPSLLADLLAAGGDPNTRLYYGKPLIEQFFLDANLDAITFLAKNGADLDAEFDGWPLITDAAISVDWDVVWRLIQLGARTDTPKARRGLVESFNNPGATGPGGPLYADKVRVYNHLRAQGDNPTPPMPDPLAASGGTPVERAHR